jgi:hypothetical protein
MKLLELFESASQLSQEAFESLPSPSPKNVDFRFKVGNVAFDNENGMGATPNNANVNYLGFTIMMTPADFLAYALPGQRKEKAKELASLMKKHVPIGAPFLTLDINLEKFESGEEPLRVVVDGHEGRARTLAIEMLNGAAEKFPVNIFPRNLRARHLNEKFFEVLREVGMVPESESRSSSAKPKKSNFGKIFWAGKEV